MNLTETPIRQTVIYEGKIITVRVDDARLPNGKTAKREVVEHPGGVCIAALTDADELLFVRQFRYPYAEVIPELPAGKLNRGEDPLPAGMRELKGGGQTRAARGNRRDRRTIHLPRQAVSLARLLRRDHPSVSRDRVVLW